MTSTPAPVLEAVEHRHAWRVFAFEFPLTIGYRCTVCHEERFEKPAENISGESRMRRR